MFFQASQYDSIIVPLLYIYKYLYSSVDISDFDISTLYVELYCVKLHFFVTNCFSLIHYPSLCISGCVHVYMCSVIPGESGCALKL